MTRLVLGEDAAMSVLTAVMFLIVLSLILLALCVVYGMRNLARRVRYMEEQLKEDGCEAFREGRLSYGGGPFEIFHRQAHARQDGVSQSPP